MKNENKTEDIFKQKTEEKTFQYEDAYWQDAKKLLNTKKRFRFGWWSAALLALLIGSVTYVGLQKLNNHSTVNTIAIKNDSKNENQVSTIDNEIKNNTEKDLNHKLLPDKKVENVNKIITGNDAKQNHIVANSSMNGKNNYASENNKNKNHIDETENKKLQTISNHHNISQNENNNSIAKITSSSKIVNPDGAILSEIKNKDEAKNKNEEVITLNEKVYEDLNTVETENKPENNSLQQLNNDIKSTVTANQNEITADSTLDKKESPLKTTADSAITVNQKSDTINKFKPFIRKQSIIADAGININNAINATGNNNFNIGMLPYFGLNYSSAIDHNNKLFFETGLQICASTHINATTEIHHSNYYSFGYGMSDSMHNTLTGSSSIPVEDSVFTLNQKTIYLLQLPISFSYAIASKHLLHFGVGVSYTMNVYSNVKNFNASSSNELGYKDGFKKINAFVQFGYAYQLTDKCKLQLNYQQGLTDMTDNIYFHSNRKNTSSHLQMGLRYEFGITSKKNIYAKQ